MKTAREWFEMLNEPERSQAIERCSNLDKKKFASLDECIRLGIIWGLQDKQNWRTIHDKIVNGTYQFQIEPDNPDFGPSQYWLDKIKPDIYQLIDQLIKEGKEQGYKISVTIE